VLCSHLIDEVADLLEHVVVLDRGRVVLDDDVDALRGRAVTVSGPAASVERFVAGCGELHRAQLGSTLRVTAVGAPPTAPPDLEVAPVSLQELVVRTSTLDRPSGARPEEAPVTAVLDIVRLHLVDRRFVLGSLLTVPLFVALASGVAAVEVAATGSFGRGFATGIVAGFYGGAAAVQATSISRLLPFAVAMGRTRREVHLGTLLFGLLLSLVLGALLHLALAVERLTGGWAPG
jgi:hypothetical protein